MVAGDVISIGGLVMRYVYIPIGIKRELLRYGVYCDQKGYIVRTVGGGTMTIDSKGKPFRV